MRIGKKNKGLNLVEVKANTHKCWRKIFAPSLSELFIPSLYFLPDKKM